MNVSLRQIISALKELGVNDEHLKVASHELSVALHELDEVEVKGRQNVDTLLGCMMALESIIGKEDEHGR